jgi:hypothetical protein
MAIRILNKTFLSMLFCSFCLCQHCPIVATSRQKYTKKFILQKNFFGHEEMQSLTSPSLTVNQLFCADQNDTARSPYRRSAA